VASPILYEGQRGLALRRRTGVMRDMNFYEKALFVKPTWRLCVVAWHSRSVPFALRFYPHSW
jgi:hypothetical protein